MNTHASIEVLPTSVTGYRPRCSRRCSERALYRAYQPRTLSMSLDKTVARLALCWVHARSFADINALTLPPDPRKSEGAA